MRPCNGDALALIFCFPAGTQAPLVFLWLLSNSKIWHMVFSWTASLTQHCVALKGMLMLWKEEEQERAVNRGKASSLFSFDLFLCSLSVAPVCTNIYTARHDRVVLCCLDGSGGSRG